MQEPASDTSSPLSRRELCVAIAALVVAGCEATSKPLSASNPFEALNDRVGGRLGVAAFDSHSGERMAWNEYQRFAMASTFKLPLAAALLWQVDRKAFPLEHRLVIAMKDLVPNSPVVSARLTQGQTSMTVKELCEAIIVESDNAAANVLLSAMGGPRAFNAFLATIGDSVTHLDRLEPELNANEPGDPRDSTTPRAMVDTVANIFGEKVLLPESIELLSGWIVKSNRGLERLRAGFPKNWYAGDKTGTGENGAINDIAVARPPGRKPIFIAVYMSESASPIERLQRAHADIGAIIAKKFVPA
jgi:beta-lactamase class A